MTKVLEDYQVSLEGQALIEKQQVDFITRYDESTLVLAISNAELDLQSLLDQRVQDFNLVLPDNGNMGLASLQGQLMLTEGEQAFRFDALFSNICPPFPYLKDTVRCTYGHIAFQYTPAQPDQQKDKELSLIAEAAFTFTGTLQGVLPDTQGAWVMTNSASLAFVNFTGQLDLAKIINALFATELNWGTIDIHKAGMLQISTTSKGSEAVSQLKQATDDSETSWPKELPPLEYTPTQVNLPEILPLNLLGSDFQLVKGSCFWFDIAFQQFSLFNNLVKVGYNDSGQIVFYGLVGLTRDSQGKEVQSKILFAQLPRITLLNFLTFQGSQGRKGIQLQYELGQNKHFALDGQIALDVFDKEYAFDGALDVTDQAYTGELILAGDSPNQSISQPFSEPSEDEKGDPVGGMLGIELYQLEFKVEHTFEVADKEQPENNKPASTDISLQCHVEILKINFTGELIYTDNSPQLAVITLDQDKPLSLTDMITSVFGQSWHWMDAVTDKFALSNGQMYYLKAPDKAPDNYTLTRQNIVYHPGYHVSAQLKIFSYLFNFDLAVIKKGILLKAGLDASTPLDVLFIHFDQPNLTIDTTGSNKTFTFGSRIYFFSDDSNYFQLSTTYNDGTFTGFVEAHLGTVTLPGSGELAEETEKSGVNLTVYFKWSETSNFEITRIDGLPVGTLNLIEQMANRLNQLSGSGCEKVAKEMMGDLCKTQISPSLRDVPSEDGSNMVFPAVLTYQMSLAGYDISEPIDIDLKFKTPHSLSDLPASLFLGIFSNAAYVAEQMLKNPRTYQAIAIEAGKRGLISLAARMLCRALKNFERAVVDAIVDGLSGVVAATLAEAIELAAVMTTAVLTGISVVVGLLKKFWNWLTGKDDDKKKEAEQKIRAARTKIQSQLDILFSKVKVIQDTQLQYLKVGINTQNNFTANWDPATDLLQSGQSSDNLSIDYNLTLLSGQPGDTHGQPWQNSSNITLKGVQSTQYEKPLSQIPDSNNFHLNASVFCTLEGFVFASDQTRSSIESSIQSLRKVDDSLAKEFASELEGNLQRLETLNKGIQCQPVYASVDDSNAFTVGLSRIGLNTRL
ncbi:hypothetical protein [Endozoicomonas arenosclerae]|uniref:hypothetical protein n=1 Tax=Endozoicomonas arenosclerae TaxID=1633495 RepID=UPI000784BA23|nr:hypothetical protein [Endozoicomonas arenosclerae]